MNKYVDVRPAIVPSARERADRIAADELDALVEAGKLVAVPEEPTASTAKGRSGDEPVMLR